MRHNKIIGWDSFLGVVEKVQRVSPWLSRQIARRASEWPFWMSGAQVKEWESNQVWVHLPLSFRNTVDAQISHGHMVLAAELTLRLLLLRFREEFPFRYRIRSFHLDSHHSTHQALDFKFKITFEEWERIRLELAKTSHSLAEFVFPAFLVDGRLAATFTFEVGFELEKFLPAY